LNFNPLEEFNVSAEIGDKGFGTAETTGAWKDLRLSCLCQPSNTDSFCSGLIFTEKDGTPEVFHETDYEVAHRYRFVLLDGSDVLEIHPS
jgi:hypothetical protein